MSGILLPEVVIYNTLESIIRLLREDIIQHPNKDEETILYKILGIDEEGRKIKLNLYNYYKQAKKIVSVVDNLSVNFGYNQEVAKIISLHILLPSENSKMVIGADEGYIETTDGDEFQAYHTQTFDTTYQIMITSNNSMEVNVVYNILKSMLLMLVPHLELMGLRTPTFSGNDIVMQDDLTPVPIFHKVINITFKYEHNVPQLLSDKVAKNFYYQMRLINLEDDKE